jgi:hypothetical protein
VPFTITHGKTKWEHQNEQQTQDNATISNSYGHIIKHSKIAMNDTNQLSTWYVGWKRTSWKDKPWITLYPPTIFLYPSYLSDLFVIESRFK